MNATQPTAGTARPDGRGTVGGTGPTYYLDREIQVTQRHLYVRGAQFVIAELDDIAVDREACPAIGVIAATVVAISVVVLAGGVVTGAATLAMVAGIGIVLAVPAAALTWHGRPYELWASYRGLDVRLYSCQDQVRFGKVTRAIVRARRHPA
jgi:hypothetical protein